MFAALRSSCALAVVDGIGYFVVYEYGSDGAGADDSGSGSDEIKVGYGTVVVAAAAAVDRRLNPTQWPKSEDLRAVNQLLHVTAKRLVRHRCNYLLEPLAHCLHLFEWACPWELGLRQSSHQITLRLSS